MPKKKNKSPKQQEYFDKEKVNQFLKSYTVLLPFIVINDKFNSILEYLLTTEINDEKIIDVQNKPALLFHAAYFKASSNFKTLVNIGKIKIDVTDKNNLNVLNYALCNPIIHDNHELFKCIYNRNVSFYNLKEIIKFISEVDRNLIQSMQPSSYKEILQITKLPLTKKQTKENPIKLSEKFKKDLNQNLVHERIKESYVEKFHNIRKFLTVDEARIKYIQNIFNNTGIENEGSVSPNDFNKTEEKIILEQDAYKLLESQLKAPIIERSDSTFITLEDTLHVYEKILQNDVEYCIKNSDDLHLIISALAPKESLGVASNNPEKTQSKESNTKEGLKKILNDEKNTLSKLKEIFDQLDLVILLDNGSAQIKLPQLLKSKQEYYDNKKDCKFFIDNSDSLTASIFLLKYFKIFDALRKHSLKELSNIIDEIKVELKLFSAESFQDPEFDSGKPGELLIILNQLNDIYLDLIPSLDAFIIKTSKDLLNWVGGKEKFYLNAHYTIYSTILIKHLNKNVQSLSDQTLDLYLECKNIPSYLKLDENIASIFADKVAVIYENNEINEGLSDLKALYNIYSQIPEATITLKYFMYIFAINSGLYEEALAHLEDVKALTDKVPEYSYLRKIYAYALKHKKLIDFENEIEKQNQEYKKLKANADDDNLSELDKEKELEIGLGIKFNGVDLNDENVQVEDKPDGAESFESQPISPKDLHRFITHYKKHLESQIHKSSQAQGWKYSGKDYCISNKNIYQISSNIFLYFNENELKGKYENIEHLLKSAENALAHGFVRSSKGVCGVKFLKNKSLITIKVPSKNDRICATKVMENPEGAKLILFDTILTHKEIDKLPALGLDENWLETMTISVENYQLDQEQNALSSALPSSTAEWENFYYAHNVQKIADYEHSQEILDLIGTSA